MIAGEFYTCKWIVQRPRARNRDSLVRAVLQEQKCVLYMSDIKRDENQLFYREAIWQVPSREVLDICLEHIRPYLGFSEYYPSDAAQIEKRTWYGWGYHSMRPRTDWRGFGPFYYEKEPSGSDHMPDSVEDDEVYGQENEAVLYNISRWGRALWTIRPLEEPDLENILELLDKEPYSLRYDAQPDADNPGSTYPGYSLNFLIKVGPPKELSRFLEKFKPYMQFEQFWWLYEFSDFIRHVQCLDLDELLTLKSLNRANNEDFLRLTKQYGSYNL